MDKMRHVTKPGHVPTTMQTGGHTTQEEHEKGIIVLVAEIHASCHNKTKDKMYHGLLVYDRGDYDYEEGLLLCWVVTPTQQTADGDRYTVLLDYEDNRSVMMISHTLGDRLIDVGRTINGGEGVVKMMKRLTSVPRTTTQSLGINKEMGEICDIFHTTSKTQTLMPIMIPLEIHDRLSRHEHDTRDGAKGQAREHVIMEMSWSDTSMPVILADRMPARNGDDVNDVAEGLCVEIEGNKDWLAKY